MAAHHYVHVDVSSNYSSLNALLHKYQEYGCNPSMYTLMSYQIIFINDTLYTSQLYVCFLMFIRWCVFKTLILLNDFLHTSHWYGCSPVSICWCVWRLPLLLNNLLHTTEENVSSPLCTNLCFQIPPVLNLKHTSHLNGFSPLSITQHAYDLTTSYAHHGEMNTPQHSDVVALHYV
jgi:hypothetical protein